jgi:uncharacterized repeat protein (TIGR01451 family)
VTIDRWGRISADYEGTVEDPDAVAGVGDGAGRATVVPIAALPRGGRLVFDPPGGWQWLEFRARLGHVWLPNSILRQTATIRLPGDSRSLAATAVVNRLSLAGTRLDVGPAGPVAGGTGRGRLLLVASGDIEARDVEARIQWPSAASPVTGTLEGGLVLDHGAQELVWRGRVRPGEGRELGWQYVVSPGVLAGSRLLTRARVGAAGLAALELSAAQRVQASDFSGSAKRCWRPVAAPGDVVTFTLRAANAGARATHVFVTDALPDGLEAIPGALLSSRPPMPRWDAGSRSLAWSGDLPAGGAIEIEVGTRFRSDRPVTNAMRIEDDAGTSAAAWADVVPLAARAFLPALGLVR